MLKDIRPPRPYPAPAFAKLMQTAELKKHRRRHSRGPQNYPKRLRSHVWQMRRMAYRVVFLFWKSKFKSKRAIDDDLTHAGCPRQRRL